MAATVLAAAALLLMACGPPVGEPGVRQLPSSPQVWDSSDPAVLVDAGQSYLFGSTNNMRVPVRTISGYAGSLGASKAEWDRSPRNAMPTLPAWVDPGESQIWAPSVAKIGSRYVLYFAAAHRGATTDEVNDQCIGRGIATSPMGPYAPEAAPVYCGLPAEGAGNGLPASNRTGRGALDPEVVRAADGSLFLLMALTRSQDNIGAVPLTGDGSVVGGVNAPATVLASQSQPWHDGTDDGGRAGGFLENPSMVYEPSTNTYLLFFSAGRWWSADYNTSFARCSSPTGPCTQDERGPFLKGGNGRTGPGGLTVFRDAGGTLRVAYSSWQQGHEAPANNPGGVYSRQGHWATLRVSATTDPAQQSVSLGAP